MHCVLVIDVWQSPCFLVGYPMPWCILRARCKSKLGTFLLSHHRSFASFNFIPN
jgi:hypothetical protein